MAWSFSPGMPVYIQIADNLTHLIISGKYPPGSQIPTVRQLAVETAVNPNTVQHAFAELEKRGIIETRGTLGRFVTEDKSLVEQSRHEHAKHIVKTFMKNIRQIGCTEEEIIDLIKEELL